ncbi:hypothetical protein D3C81_1539530 [compost metagenome]
MAALGVEQTFMWIRGDGVVRHLLGEIEIVAIEIQASFAVQAQQVIRLKIERDSRLAQRIFRLALKFVDPGLCHMGQRQLVIQRQSLPGADVCPLQPGIVAAIADIAQRGR